MNFNALINLVAWFDITAFTGMLLGHCWPKRDRDAVPPTPPLGSDVLSRSAGRSGDSVPQYPDRSAVPTPVVGMVRPPVDRRAYGRHAQ
jgi:hypothetical protein